MAMAEQRNKVVDVGFRVMNRVHRGIFAATGGRFPRTLLGMAAVELRTIGRKSGQSRTTMLTSPIHDDTRVVLVASKGGDDHDPQWYRNLSANPEVEVLIDGSLRKMRARTASPEEKATLWPDIVAAYKYYDSYQKRADRDIPVVICEPLPA
jgi:deazaflavin-dependent oxidoreductase (nitroreductase family)